MSTTLPPADQILATAEQIADMPRREVDDNPGIHERVLWGGEGQVTGLMTFDPGAGMAEHVHVDRSHHVFVVEGTIEVNGQALPTGSYAHVPSGAAHEVVAGSDGCTLFYVFTA